MVIMVHMAMYTVMASEVVHISVRHLYVRVYLPVGLCGGGVNDVKGRGGGDHSGAYGGSDVGGRDVDCYAAPQHACVHAWTYVSMSHVCLFV